MNDQETISQLASNSSDLRELLEAHLQKLEKVNIFQNAFEKMVVNGNINFAASWSWWAFFGGPFYFFYRKMYVQGAILLLVSLVGMIIPFLSLGTSIFAGITAKFFYVKKFAADAGIAGYGKNPMPEVKETMARLGGFNTWAIIAYAALIVLAIIGSIIVMVAATAASMQYY